MALQSAQPDLSDLIEQLQSLEHTIPKDDATRKALYDVTRNLIFFRGTPKPRMEYGESRYPIWGLYTLCVARRKGGRPAFLRNLIFRARSARPVAPERFLGANETHLENPVTLKVYDYYTNVS